MPELDNYLRALNEQKATALHLTSGRRPMLRVDGRVVPIMGEALLDDLSLRALLRDAIGAERWEAFLRTQDAELTLNAAGLGRFRGACALTDMGVNAVFERVTQAPEPISALGLPQMAQALAASRAGLVMFCGPHGSGKSTTLTSLIDHINATQRVHIITLESPITTLHKPQRAVVTQREINRHTTTFPAAIRAALRQDADILCVGELSERDAIAYSLDAAHQGMLVLAEAHTPTVVSAIEGVLGAFGDDARSQARLALSEQLLGVVSQVLCRRKDGGRVAAYEVLTCTPAVRELITGGDAEALQRHIDSASDGVQRLDDSLQALVESGAIDGREAYRRAHDKRRFSQHAPGG